jgi:hypothetical protein
MCAVRAKCIVVCIDISKSYAVPAPGMRLLRLRLRTCACVKLLQLSAARVLQCAVCMLHAAVCMLLLPRGSVLCSKMLFYCCS